MTRDEAIDAVTDAFIVTHAHATDPEVGVRCEESRELLDHAVQVGGVGADEMFRETATLAVDALIGAGLVLG